jgi:hypothetical protein
MGEYLRYDQGGLSKYAIVSVLFPRDSYTHRMKRLQRAARQGVWAKHFDVIASHGSYGHGMYPVQRLALREPSLVIYSAGGSKAKVHTDNVRCVYADLLFPHEKQARDRAPAPLTRLWQALKDMFWYF